MDSFFGKLKQVFSSEKEEKLYASSRSFQSVGDKYKDGRMVSVTELNDIIVDTFSELLEAHGFRYLKSKKSFKRDTKTGCDEISIHTLDYTHYHFNFSFTKRIDNIQKIITAFNFQNGYSTVSNYKERWTIHSSYKHITGHEIIAKTLSVFKEEIKKALPFIEKEVLPQFERLNSMDILNQTLNYPEKEKGNLFTYFPLNQFSRVEGVTVAKVINDPNYENLLNRYLTERSEDFITPEKLRRLDEYLKETL